MRATDRQERVVTSGGTWLRRVVPFAAALVCVSSLAHTARLTAWPVDPLVKVLHTAAPPEAAARPVVVEACRGEVENGQIAVRSDGDVRLSASATPLTSDAGQSLAPPQVRFVGYVHLEQNTEPHLAETGPQVLVAEAPVDLPDPLLEDRFLSLKAGETGAVWLTVSVPRDARPGTYVGRVLLSADGVEQSLPVRVRVHHAVLPAEMHLKVVNWYYPVVLTHTYRVQWWDEEFWQLVAADAESMARHRQSVAYVILNETITAVEGRNGAVGFDFANFDRLVETFRQAGLPWTMGSALAGRHVWASTDFYAIPLKLRPADGTEGQFPASEDPESDDEAKRRVHVMSGGFETYAAAFLPALEEHLVEKGWADTYIQLQADEPIDTNAAAYRRLGQLVKRHAPRLQRAEANRTTDIVGAVDIWVPLLSQLDAQGAFYRERQAAGDEVWFYTCERPRGRYLNRFIDYPLLKTRLIHWANHASGTTGYLHWGYNPSWGNPFSNPGSPPGDGHLVYPGVARLRGAAESEDRRHSLDSIRYEAMRDGIEDYELLRLLAERDQRKANEIRGMVVRNLTDYTLDPDEFNTARRELLLSLR